MSSCVDLKEPVNQQGAGMINLKLLFDDGKDNLTNNTLPKSTDLERELFEHILMILIIIFLLDSRV